MHSRGLLLALALLAGCAQQPRLDSRFDSIGPRPPRASIMAWSIEGRISVTRGDRAQQAGIDWQHRVDSDRIDLGGPLGQRMGRLTRDAAGARLERANHEMIAAPDWNALAVRVLDVGLPLDDMAQWLTGVVSDGAVSERDALGRVQRAQVKGWQIDYLRYEADSADALPTLIEIRRDDISAKLKIDQWQLD